MKNCRLDFLNSGAAALVAVFALGTGSAIAQELLPPPMNVEQNSATPIFPPSPQAPVATMAPPMGTPAPSSLIPAADYPGAVEGAGTVSSAGPNGAEINLSGSEALIDTLSVQAGQRLESMVGSEASPATNDDLVEQLLHEERATRLLQKRLERANVAIDLWGALYNNEHAQAMRTRNDQRLAADAQIAAMEAERQRRESSTLQLTGAERTVGSALGAPAGMLSSFPVVTEVNGNQATLLVPGAGEVVVSNGSRLANGMRVSSISLTGVVVNHGGENVQLGFGTSVGGEPVGDR